jgi:ABC-type transporter Mla subunit MlaD
MRPGSAVQMMGIRIGQVEEVIPVINEDTSFVQIKFVITEPDIAIPQASTISIQQSGIIGEKFLEITPPQIQTIFLPVTNNLKTILTEKTPVELLVGNDYMIVGEIKKAEILDKKLLTEFQQEYINTPFAYKVDYIVTKPGIIVPQNCQATIRTPEKNTQNLDYVLRLNPPENILVQISSDGKYTIVEPTRLKKFFDVQLKAAVALQETNDKINALLSEESIDDLKSILKNTKSLTKEANLTLIAATDLLNSSKEELDILIALATNLSNKMMVLTDNINGIIGDPKVKNNLLATTESIQKSANSISNLLDDPKLAETLTMVNSSSKDIAEITSYLNEITKNEEFKGKIDSTITNLNTSLVKISNTLDSINSLSASDKDHLKDILKDSTEISENLKKFSDKLNGRFLLIRLLF